MKVYVVETGCYEDRCVSGVYATLEAAMAAHPVRDPIPKEQQRGSTHERPGGWQLSTDGRDWQNGLDWSDHATITAYDVEGPPE